MGVEELVDDIVIKLLAGAEKRSRRAIFSYHSHKVLLPRDAAVGAKGLVDGLLELA